MKRDELIDALEETRAELDAVLAGLSEQQWLAPGASGAWSAKDVVAHLTAWEVDLLTNLGKARRGIKPGRTNWTDATIEAQNKTWHAEMKARPVDRVLADFRGARAQTLRQLEGLTDKELAASPWWLGRPLLDYVVSHTLKHEREHLEALHAWRQTRPAAGEGEVKHGG